MSSNVLTYIIEVQDKVSDKLKTIQKGVLRQPSERRCSYQRRDIYNSRHGCFYYLHIDPNKLTDEEWAEKFKQLADIRKREGKMR